MKKVINFLHVFFIPKEENNFRARALHLNFLSLYLLLAIFSALLFKNINANFYNVLGVATDISAEKLFEATNQERAKNNLPPLSYNEKLAGAAYKKAEDMFKRNYWSHYGPDGTTPWNFIADEGYQYNLAGENLAKNFMFTQGVIEAWMNSTTHRENILKKDYAEVGFAVVNGVLNGEQTTLVVQMFGKPQSGLIQTLSPSSAPKTISSNSPQDSVSSPKAQSSVLSQSSNKSLFSMPQFSFNMNVAFILFFLAVLALDFYHAGKTNVVKIGGKNPAHFIFLSFILMSILFLIKGSII